MLDTIKVNHKYTSIPYLAKQWLQDLPDTIACDFETASMYTEAEQAKFKEEIKSLEKLEEPNDWVIARLKFLRRSITLSGLSHPSEVNITHFSCAWSESDAFVLIIDSPAMENMVMKFLTETEKLQIWHNLSFDGKLIMHRTGKLPKNFEDSQVFAWSLLNHSDTFKAKTGLKELMGYSYGDWAVSSDLFTSDNLKNENLIKYAAIDACATYKLYHDIKGELDVC